MRPRLFSHYHADRGLMGVKLRRDCGLGHRSRKFSYFSDFFIRKNRRPIFCPIMDRTDTAREASFRNRITHILATGPEKKVTLDVATSAIIPARTIVTNEETVRD